MSLPKENDEAKPARSYVEESACVMVYYAAERTLMAWVRVALGGSLLALTAAVRSIGLELRFRREDCGAPGRGLPPGVTFTLFVALIGVAIAAFLAGVRYREAV